MKISKDILGFKRHLLDDRINHLKDIRNEDVPANGWLKAIRESMGIPAELIADKLNISQPALHELESNEVKGTITINSLKRVAQSLNCEVKYFVVPKEPYNTFEDIVDAQIEKAANEEIKAINQTMLLENQEADNISMKWLIDDAKKKIKDKMPSKLWKL